jgi:hypothetical protein
MGHHLASDVPTEDIEHDVEVEVGPLGWAKELRDAEIMLLSMTTL